ncbi:MAG: hypothetical protein NZ761_11110, partial [Dehalococcoidia bacterium]|nr:hypothetical protein [Dehalococcoidia bacterium]
MRRIGLGMWASAVGLLLLGGGMLAAAGTSPVGAGTPPTFHDVHLELAVPRDGTWYVVGIQLFVMAGEDGEVSAEAAAARDAILDRFPGAVPLDDGDVHAQWVAAGWKWPSGSASWQYNDAGKPLGLSGDAAAISGGA